MYWRNSKWSDVEYPSCNPIQLPEGLLISHDFDRAVQFVKSSIFHQRCFDGIVPLMNTNNGQILNKLSERLPIAEESWSKFTKAGDRGSFAYSIVSIIYSISTLAVITWFLNLFVVTNYTVKPSFLLRASTSLSSIYLGATVIISIIELRRQQNEGFLQGKMLLNKLNSSLILNIIDLIVVFLLQISQVQVIMRIFLRQKEKRLAFFIGVSASITSQVIWAVTKFHSFSEESEAGDILPAFQYLVRIAMGVCYAALITVFILTKLNYIIVNNNIWLITLLTIILIYGPVAFFIADVSNVWVYELSEVFSVVTYDICVVIPWEWCNKFNTIMRAKEKEGILGRKFYEDELYELDRLELFVEEQNENNDNDNDNNNGPDNNNVGRYNDEPPPGVHNVRSHVGKRHFPSNLEDPNKFHKILNTFNKAKLTFLNITDDVIAKGLAIPRSTSAFSTSPIHGPPRRISRVDPLHNNVAHNSAAANQIHYDNNDNNINEQTIHSTRINAPNNSSGLENIDSANGRHPQHRRDVFLYTTREVIIDVSEDES